MPLKAPTINLRDKPGIVLAAICVLLSVFAFSFSASYEDGSAALTFDVNSILQFAIAAISIYLFRRLFWCKPFKPSLVECMIAVLFAVMSVLGFLLDSAKTLAVSSIAFGGALIGSPAAIAFAIFLMAAGFFLFYYAATDWLFAKITELRTRASSRTRTAQDAPHKPPTFFKRNLTLPLCAAIMLVAWLPYIIYFFPFTVTTDTSYHLAQLLGDIELTTHFPYLPGLIESKLYEFGKLLEPTGTLGMFFMGIIQVLIGLFVFAEIVTWLKKLRVPNWLVYGALAFFALFPLVPIYMVQIGKDTLHAEFIALFALQLFLFCLSKRNQCNAQSGQKPDCESTHQPGIPRSILYSPWMIALTALLVALTRNNGIIMVVFALVICTIAYKDKWAAAATVAMCACFCIWQFAVVPACGVKSEGSTEACSMPAQMIAACLQDGTQPTDEERDHLRQFFTTDLTSIASLYNPESSDPVKDNLSVPTLGNAAQFADIALAMAKENPATAISAALCTTYGTWYPFCRGSYHSEDTPYIVADLGSWHQIEQWYASADQQQAVAEAKHIGIQALAALHYIPIVSMLYTPGVYLWLLILIFGYAFKARANRKLTATVLSAFFILWLVLLFGPCASLRYIIPAVFSLPIFIAILAVGTGYSKTDASKYLEGEYGEEL